MTSRPTPSRVADAPSDEPSFFGRETELAMLRSLVRARARRRITIVGPPGIGKTRLARVISADDVIRTSRRRLNDEGEVVVELGPLDPKAALDLFVATFARSRPDPPLSKEELSQARELVDHPSVDRVPLAIELVAARAALLGVRSLLLDDTASRTVLEAMRGSVEDCFLALGSEEERDALERLSVFRGTFDLACARAMDVSPHIVAALRESSLIRESAARFTLHGVVRDFAFERLSAHGSELENALDRRDAFFCGPDGGLNLDLGADRSILKEHYADLLAIAERGKDPSLGLRAILALLPTVIASGGAASLIPILSKLLDAVPDRDDPIVGQAFAARGRLRRRVGRVKEAAADEDAALAIATTIGDLALEGGVLGERAFVQAGSAPASETRALFERAAHAQRRADDKAGLALTLLRRAGWQRDLGALADARADAEAAFALASTVGHRAHVVHALVELSLTLVELDDDEALKMLDKTKTAAREAGERFVEGYAELGAGMFLHARGALDSAASRHRNALEIVREVPRTAECIRGYLAVIALEKSRDTADELEAKSELRRASAVLREAGEPRYATLFDAYAGGPPATSHEDQPYGDGIGRAIRVLTATPSRRELEALSRIAEKTSSDLRIALRVVRTRHPPSVEERDDGVPNGDVDLVVGDDGSWLTVGARSFDLSKHRAQGAILVRLANAHIEARGEAVSAMDLIRVAWPNERIAEAAAHNRLRVALAALRKYPVLKDAIVTSRQGGGYFLDPGVSVRLSTRN